MVELNVSSNDLLDCLYSGCYWNMFVEIYGYIRLPLAILICTIGSCLNVLNMIIFTRPKMRTPVNVFLTSLSLAQLLFTIDYFLLVLVEYFRALCYPIAWTYAITIYELISVNLNSVLNAVAFAHVLAVAAFRVRSMQPPVQLNQFLYGNDWALSTVAMIWIFIPLFCIPLYFTSSLFSVYKNYCDFEETVYEHGNVKDRLLIGTVFWVFGVALKLLPSAFAIFLLQALIRLPLSSEEFRRRLRESQQQQRKVSSSSRRSLATNHHPTRTLATLLIISFMIQLPNGIYNLYEALKGQSNFNVLMHGHLNSLTEILLILQHSTSFPIYWLTLIQFRQTLSELFRFNTNDDIKEEHLLSKKRTADSVMLTKEKQKRKFTRSGNEIEDGTETEAMTAKTSVTTRPQGPYPTIIISNDTRNITKLTF